MVSSLAFHVLSQSAENSWTEEWLEMTLNALHKNRLNFAIIVKKLPLTDNVDKHYVEIVKQLLSDGVVSTARVVTILAFATYLQELFTIDLKKTTANLLEENVFVGFAVTFGALLKGGILDAILAPVASVLGCLLFDYIRN